MEPDKSRASGDDADPPSCADPPPGRSGWPWDVGVKPRATTDAPRISVVTPSYNQAPYLEEAIRSVVLQGYPNLEYIVVDGGSIDGSAAIIARYRRWLASAVIEADTGQADAVNKGFLRSTGDIMGWLNADDVLLPGSLWRIASAFESPEINVVCGFRRYIDAQSQHLHNGVHERPTRHTLERFCYLAQETVYWRRSVWETIGPLDPSYQYALDFEYWHRMLAAGYEIELLPYFLACFRLHSQSKGALLGNVRETEISALYKGYLERDVSFRQMTRELGPAWWIRRRLYRILRDTPVFERPAVAARVVRLLSPLKGGFG